MQCFMQTGSTKSTFSRLAKGIFIGLCAMSASVVTVQAHADDKKQGDNPSATLSASESDPNKLGWMQGFPPPDDKLIGQPQSDFFSFPKLRWTVCHIRELMPTTQVSRGLDAPSDLTYDLDPNIDNITFTPTGSSKPMTWKQSLAANYTDGILVMHHGKVVYEDYSGCLTPTSKHAAMSMTKSLTGLLAETLVQEGKLDDTALVSSIIPELKDSGFGDATVRQVMDMTTALDYSEDYSDPDAEIWEYTAAADPLPKPDDYDGPIGYFEYLQTVEKKGEHGEVFSYRTINSDVLGWIVSRTTGTPMDKLLSERIWQHIGAEQDAYMTIDSKGTPFAGGGVSAGLRDLARIGQLVHNHGQVTVNGKTKRLFPASVTDSIKQGGDKAVFAKAGYDQLHNGSYKSMWWLFNNPTPIYAARGVHGQTIYIDPAADMIIVRLASHPVAGNGAIDPTSLPAYAALASYLVQK